MTYGWQSLSSLHLYVFLELVLCHCSCYFLEDPMSEATSRTHSTHIIQLWHFSRALETGIQSAFPKACHSLLTYSLTLSQMHILVSFTIQEIISSFASHSDELHRPTHEGQDALRWYQDTYDSLLLDVVLPLCSERKLDHSRKIVYNYNYS